MEKLDLMGKVRLFRGRLYNHDYLWFSSTEISKTSVTFPALHNYALSYALAQYERGVSMGSTPTYQADLAQMPLYATPAIYSGDTLQRTAITFNALDEITQGTVAKPAVNTPDYGTRVYLNLQFEPRQQAKKSQGYEFYLFVFNDEPPRCVIRLGKKGCPVRIDWQELTGITVQFSVTIKRPSHVVNPLDISGQIKMFEPFTLPPHLLFRRVDISHDWFIEQAGQIIHVPKSVVARLQGERAWK